MFSVNDVVKYGSNGTCRIIDISKQAFGVRDEEYYILQPLRNKNSMFYVPIHNDALVARMEKILSADAVYELILDIPRCCTEWIENDKKRMEKYSSIIVSGSRRDIIGVIRTLHRRKLELEEINKRLHAADERLMKDAERIIHDEFAAVLNIDVSEVAPLIAKILENGV